MTWQTTSLGEVVALQRGYDLPEQDRRPGQFPIVGSAGPNGTHDEANVRGPGVVIGRSGAGFGSAHYCETDFWALNTGLFVSDFRGNHPRFIFYLLDYLDFTPYNSGGAQPSLNRNFIYPVPVELPPTIEQKKITDLLFVWESAIEKTERIMEAQKQRNDALANQLIFGKRRLGQRRAHTTQALHWFSMPCDWRIAEIGQIAREVSETNGGGEDLPVLSCTKYDGLVDSLKYFDKQVFSHDTSKYKVVRRGQFAYATNHIEEGSVGYQDLMPAGLVSPIYTVFQADPAQIDDGYLYKLLKTEKLRQLFAANTNASVDRRGSLRWKEFARIHIPLPPLDEQRQISAVLDEAKREINLLKAKAEALKTQKRGLMQKLLTGQWRVPITNIETQESESC